VEVKLTLVDGMHFEAETGSGHTVHMDASPESGGENLGARPMELLLVGLGGCTAVDVIAMMRKARQEVTGYDIRVTGERAKEHPRVYTSIHIEHVIRGRGISEDALKRAVHLSDTRYCSASAMLGAVAKLTTSYRIIEE
jgi:putative redox protein